MKDVIEILKYETQDKALDIADSMGCTLSEIEVEKCPFCKKRSYFKKMELKPNEVEIKVCSHCGDYMNGFN